MGKRWPGKKANERGYLYKNYKTGVVLLIAAVLLMGLLAGCGSGTSGSGSGTGVENPDDWELSENGEMSQPENGETGQPENGEVGQPENGEMGQPDIAIEGPGEAEPLEEPPAVGLETTYGEMASCTYATRGGYQWTVHLNDGTDRSVVADSTSPREWKEIATIDMAKTDGTIKLQFSSGMKEYTLNYWIEDATCGVADPVPMEGDTILLEDELAKGIYEIYVVYENGSAYYGFRVE